jgi:hypothetical protein
MEKCEHLTVTVHITTIGTKDSKGKVFTPSKGYKLDPDVNWCDIITEDGRAEIYFSSESPYWTTKDRQFAKLDEAGWKMIAYQRGKLYFTRPKP